MRANRKILSVLLCACAAAAACAEPAPAQPVQAVWKPEKITLSYFSQTTYYSCDALEGKMKRIIEQLGMVGDVRVRAANCGRGVVSTPNVHIEALVPVEATPAALADIKQDDSSRELAKRVNGQRAQQIEPGAQFAAKWQDVQVGKGLDLSGGDCDLLRQIQRQLLPKLAVKVKETNRTCDSRDSSTLRHPILDLQVLLPVPTADKGA
jgi:hypothetical protein